MRDKVLHFVVGAALAAPLAWVGYPVNGVLLAGIAGIAKEAWDDRADLLDFIATLAGGIAGAVALA